MPVAGAQVLLVGDGAPVRSTVEQRPRRIHLVGARRGPLRASCRARRLPRRTASPSRAAAAARDLGSVPLQISAVSESLVVSASQVEIPLSHGPRRVTVISGRRAAGASQMTTVAEALRQVPGLTVAQSGGPGSLTAIFPRGGESDYTLVLHRRHPAECVRRRFRFRPSLADEHRSHRSRARPAERALRIERDRRGRADRDPERRPCSAATRRSKAAASAPTRACRPASAGTAGRLVLGCGRRSAASDGFNGRTDGAGETSRQRRVTRERRGGQRRLAQCRGRDGARRAPVRTRRPRLPRAVRVESRSAFSPASTRYLAARTTDGAHRSARQCRSGARVRTHGQVTWNTTDGDSSPRHRFANRIEPVGLGVSRALGTGTDRHRASSPGSMCPPALELQREQATSTYITDDSGPIPIERRVAGYFGEARWSPAERLFVTGGVRLEDIRRDAVGAVERSVQPSAGHAGRQSSCR